MKNEKNKPTFNIPLFAAILTAMMTISSLYAQVDFDDVITFESGINPDATVDFKNRSFDAEIKTWGNNSVELQMDVKLKAKDQKDIDLTLEAIRGIDFTGSESRFRINTVFWESINSAVNHKIKLNTGDKVVLKDFEIKITLFVPKTISIAIDSKYADIKMDELAGQADIKLYNGKLYGKSFGGETDLNLRYSKAFLDNLPVANLELYDSDVELASCGNLKLESKYSKIEIDRAGDFDFVSYDDNIAIGQLGQIDGEAKYTDFDFGPSINLTFDFYDCNLKGGDTGKVKGQSKYTEMELGTTDAVELNFSYDDTFKFKSTATFDCRESKYSDFEIGTLLQGFSLQSYDDNVTIEHVSADFSEIEIEGKYGDYRLYPAESSAFRLLVDMKYGKIDYDEENFDRKTFIKENDKLFLDATTKNSSGSVKSVIEIKGYDNRVILGR